MADNQDDTNLVRVQHAVVVQSGSDLRALNDLLSVGWRAVQTSPLETNVLVILENIGTPDTIEELRTALGYDGASDTE
ncbi:MAG: hypothetical protein HOI19_06195 [Rhodospirillaceae bacterium]|jgi:hypothetical protein|nr:hypothetical protein [Rhodospirillaceae bacterium]